MGSGVQDGFARSLARLRSDVLRDTGSFIFSLCLCQHEGNASGFQGAATVPHAQGTRDRKAPPPRVSPFCDGKETFQVHHLCGKWTVYVVRRKGGERLSGRYTRVSVITGHPFVR